jgi:hypothetical protein
MSMSKHIVHLKNCRIVSGEEIFSFSYLETPYKLIFSSENFDDNKGIVVVNEENGQIDINLLLWLSVYFGEDFIEPFQEEDTRFSYNRGGFEFNANNLSKFLQTTEKMPPKSFPKWKKQLFDKAIIYYSVAVRSGINMMPLTIGFFGMSLECIGNIRHGKRDKHFTLGDKRFLELINTRLKRYKLNQKYKETAKTFQKLIIKDVELVHIIRNAYYGHSMLHLQKDRRQLTEALRAWYLRSGHDKKFTNISFRINRIDNDIIREAHGLYKVGLRTCRLFIFMLLGFAKSIPFATHDYLAIGDMRKGETSKYRNMQITIK